MQIYIFQIEAEAENPEQAKEMAAELAKKITTEVKVVDKSTGYFI